MKKLLPEQWEFNLPDNIQIVDVRSIQELEPHADAWAGLLLQSTAASPMLSYPLISAFFETQILPSETWLCLFAYEGEQLVGVLPLIAVKSFNMFGLSLLCFKIPHNNFHTSAVDCLVLRDREKILELFVDYLSCIPFTWPLIRFREIPEHSPSMLYMNRHGKKLKIVQKLSGGENYIQLPADYKKYHTRLSSGFKRQLKRRTGKLDKLTDVRFLCREDKRSSVENMKRFEDAEDHGWKGEKKSSIKAVAANSRFLAIAAERFQNYGWMEWNFLEIGEKTIAAQYGIRINRTLYLIKIGYDEEYAFCTPGNLLFNKVIKNACEKGDVDEINCVADCAWHKNWGMTKRLLYDLIVPPQIPILSALLIQLLNVKIVQKYLWGIKTP
ncbi:GNAT family N-acetyltransferase [Desulfobacula sp.]